MNFSGPPYIHHVSVLRQPSVARNFPHLGTERGVNFSEARLKGVQVFCSPSLLKNHRPLDWLQNNRLNKPNNDPNAKYNRAATHREAMRNKHYESCYPTGQI